MPVVVFSPHTDDAIFSLGAHLAAMFKVTVVAPMAAIPTDGPGQAKHQTLRHEHRNACTLIGVDHIEGPFLDDAYPRPRRAEVGSWMAQFLPGATVYIPLGIHHPDHLLVSNLLINMIDIPDCVRFYAELPYRIDYPAFTRTRLEHIENMTGRLHEIPMTEHALKRAACEAYASQTDGDVMGRVMVHESAWELVR